MQGHKRGLVHLHRMYRPVRMLRATIALLVAILVLAALSQRVSLRKTTTIDTKPVSDASAAKKLNAYNSSIATSPLARVDRLVFAAHLNAFDANNLVQHAKLPSHVQALLAAVADFVDHSEQPNPNQGFLQLKLRQNESPPSVSSHPENTAVPVKLSIVLTCVGFGHTCSPTCPSPTATLLLHPMFKILPIDCPGNGSKLAKTVYNASTNALAAWKAASEWWANQMDKETLARSAMLLLSERVVGFETSDWLWELLNRGKSSPHAIAISGVLAHGSPNSYRQTQNTNPRSTVKSGWVQNVGITFRMSGLRATVDPPEVKPGQEFDWEWLPKIVKPVPVHFRQGFEAGSQGTLLSDDRNNGPTTTTTNASSREDEDEIFGVGGDVSIVSLQAVMMSGGFHAGYYDNALAVVDLCLWARENGIDARSTGGQACVVHGQSVALAPFFDYDELYIHPTLTRRLAPEFVRQDIDLMHERHGPTILAGILNNLWLDKTVTIVYDSVWGKGCSGWSAEILPYLVALESRVFSIVASTTDKWCSGMYPYYKGVIERQRLNPIQHKPSKEFPLIFINHVQGGFYSKYPSHNWINNWFVYLPSAQPWFPVFVKPTIRIGRSMTETNTLSKNSYFPAGFAKGVDQVWVPAPFLVDVFEKTGGCRKGSVKVARETVDLLHFDAHRKSGMRVPEDLRGLRDSRWFEWLRRKEDLNTAAGSTFKEFAVGHVAQDGSSELQNITVRSSGTRNDKTLVMKTRGEIYLPAEDEPCQFIFLAVFKWEPRKDPENLIRAFLQTFGLDSGVCLLISTKVAGRGVDANQVHDHSRIYSAIQKIVDEMAWEHGWDPRGYQPPAALHPTNAITYVQNTPDSGHHWAKKLKPVGRPDRSVTNLSKAIKVTTQLREWEELPAMYKVADAFVSSSHGEGWGLPVHEAMAMELPVIASATTGHLAFLNSQNSWPVALEMERGKPKRVKVPAESEQDFGPLAHWDLVDWKHLSAMMLSVALQKCQMMDDARRRGLDTLDAVRDEYEIGSKPRRARAWLQQALSPNKVMREWTALASEAVREKLSIK
ncbi:hypothetical protein CcCBS67573_g04860 [Chytriomyces confervae]|uniref:Glycosyl transferase family 1 domain-containing protein n=1 Tax=Chytriomyces confervae TaxID=246404 RepID=A0A507FEZ8_9FUNG|nr:hypothetical protein CcCBS67573_g04860 [Chytriomyces confervae]